MFLNQHYRWQLQRVINSKLSERGSVRRHFHPPSCYNNNNNNNNNGNNNNSNNKSNKNNNNNNNNSILIITFFSLLICCIFNRIVEGKTNSHKYFYLEILENIYSFYNGNGRTFKILYTLFTVDVVVNKKVGRLSIFTGTYVV